MSAPLRVVWVSFAPLERDGGRTTSSFASVRYRLLLPSTALHAQGCDSKVVAFSSLAGRLRDAEAVVLGKLLAPDVQREAREVLEMVAQLRAARVAVLADFSDDHFADPARGEAYRAIANGVDAVVTSTEPLAEVLRQHTPATVSVVTDPVEGERREPRVPPRAPYELLWFGHGSNLQTLQQALPQLSGQHLTVVSAPGIGAERIGARFRAWAPRAVFDELRKCDAVVIPSDPGDPRKAVKSPNRFTEAVWAGRFVLAHPLPAYRELAEFGWVGENLAEGLRWLAAQPQEALARIRGGQALIAERFSPRAVGDAWKAVIERTLRAT